MFLQQSFFFSFPFYCLFYSLSTKNESKTQRYRIENLSVFFFSFVTIEKNYPSPSLKKKNNQKKKTNKKKSFFITKP